MKTKQLLTLVLILLTSCLMCLSCKKESDSPSTPNPVNPNTPMITVYTNSVTNITYNSAQCSGRIDIIDSCNVSYVGMCWSTLHNPSTDDNFVYNSYTVGMESFSFGLSDLNYGTTYYVRAFAMLETETVYGEEEMFVTEDFVHVVLDYGGKVQINTQTGYITFEDNDVVYVGNNGKYVGELGYSDGKFVGDLKICNLSEDDYLHFYILGNLTPEETLIAGSSENCSAIITNQKESLPLISYGRSMEKFYGPGDYSTLFGNRCSLVKFVVTTPSNAAVCIKGLMNKVVVDFSSNSISYSQEREGIIKLSEGGGVGVEKWAILLPQNAMPVGLDNSLYTEDMMYGGIRPEIPQILPNYFLTGGIVLDITTPLCSND